MQTDSLRHAVELEPGRAGRQQVKSRARASGNPEALGLTTAPPWYSLLRPYIWSLR
jgi:hypothetical protein